MRTGTSIRKMMANEAALRSLYHAALVSAVKAGRVEALVEEGL